MHWDLRLLQTGALLFVMAPSSSTMEALNFGALDELESEISAVMRYHEISSLGSKFGTKPRVYYAGWDIERGPFHQ